MQQDNIQKGSQIRITFKRIAIILSILLLVILIAVGTVIALANLTQKTTNKTQAKSVTALKVIFDLNTTKTIAGLSTDLYQQQANPTALIQYKLDGYNYSVNTITKESLIFSALNKSQADDTTTIQNQTATFMKQEGLTKVNNIITTTAKGPQYATFANDKTVCLLTDSQAEIFTGSTRFHSIACVDKSAITTEYVATEKLLTIYKNSQTTAPFTAATRYLASKDNVAYSIINLVSGNNRPQLLFAAVDNNWEYIGDLSVGDAKYSNGKHVITPEVQTKINDAKYKGFIAKELAS